MYFCFPEESGKKYRGRKEMKAYLKDIRMALAAMMLLVSADGGQREGLRESSSVEFVPLGNRLFWVLG